MLRQQHKLINSSGMDVSTTVMVPQAIWSLSKMLICNAIQTKLPKWWV